MKSTAFRNLPLGFFAIVALSGRLFANEVDDNAHVADARLETHILARFNGIPQLRALDISVFVAGRKIVLTGTVNDDASRAMAERIAADQAGAGNVINRLVVNNARRH